MAAARYGGLSNRQEEIGPEPPLAQFVLLQTRKEDRQRYSSRAAAAVDLCHTKHAVPSPRYLYRKPVFWYVRFVWFFFFSLL